MQKLYKFVEKSSNQKIGNMATTYSSKKLCPDTCALKRNGCYSNSSYAGMIWQKVTNGTDKTLLTFKELIVKIGKLKAGSSIRLNTAGDLPTTKHGHINRNNLKSLIAVTKNLNVFNYTHIRDPETIRWANEQGYPLIASIDNIDQLHHYEGCPTSHVVPAHLNPKKSETLADWRKRTKAEFNEIENKFKKFNRQVFRCPAQYADTTCLECKACSNIKSDQSVLFMAHGSQKNKIKTDFDKLVTGV